MEEARTEMEALRTNAEAKVENLKSEYDGKVADLEKRLEVALGRKRKFNRVCTAG